MADKVHCDLCDSVLIKEKPPNSMLEHTFVCKYWEVREKTSIFSIEIPFMRGSDDKLTLCINCILDFKEFIQRKQNAKSNT